MSKTYVLTYLSTKRRTSQPKRPTYLPYEESNYKPTKSNQEPTNSYQTCARPKHAPDLPTQREDSCVLDLLHNRKPLKINQVQSINPPETSRK